MKKIIAMALGWLTVPGIMYAFQGQKMDEPIKQIASRRDIEIALMFSVIALMAYGAAAINFGDPAFRRTPLEILSPLTGLVWVFNFIFFVLAIIGLFARKWETSNPSAD